MMYKTCMYVTVGSGAGASSPQLETPQPETHVEYSIFDEPEHVGLSQTSGYPQNGGLPFELSKKQQPE